MITQQTSEYHSHEEGDRRRINALIGVTPVFVSASEDLILFETHRDRIEINPVGDCCSGSWFESWDNIDEIAGERINDAYIILGAEWDAGHGEQIMAYAIELKTNLGVVTIEMRNQSNGYYDGWIEVKIERGQNEAH